MSESPARRTPLVSFLIAARDEERFIVECVDSCLAQSHPAIEVCVVDDGSSDLTHARLIARYGGRHDVRIERLPRNGGKCRAFNRAFSMSNGDHVALLGADDANLPDRAERSLERLAGTGADLVFGNFRYCDADLTPLDRVRHATPPADPTPERILRANFLPGGTMLFTRALARKIFPIPGALPFEDWWIAFVASLEGRIAYLDRELIRYRQHAGNECQTLFRTRYLAVKRRDYRRHLPCLEAFRRRLLASDHPDRERLLDVVEVSHRLREAMLARDAATRLSLLPRILAAGSADMHTARAVAAALLGGHLLLLPETAGELAGALASRFSAGRKPGAG